jgi:hypothetical protein
MINLAQILSVSSWFDPVVIAVHSGVDFGRRFCAESRSCRSEGDVGRVRPGAVFGGSDGEQVTGYGERKGAGGCGGEKRSPGQDRNGASSLGRMYRVK